jgi:hypothetical protein
VTSPTGLPPEREPNDTMTSSAEAPPEPGSVKSMAAVLSQLSEDFTTLLHQEVELAKAEVRQSATRAGKGAGMFGGAALAGSLTRLFLSIALWWGLGNQIGRTWSALIVALIWAVVAAVLALAGRKQIKQVEGVPRTVDTTKQIPETLKGSEHAR